MTTTLPLPLTGPEAGRRRARASIYVRLSKQADDSNTSLEGMIDACRSLVAKEDLDEVALHIDDGKTGALRDRPEFIAWLNDARMARAEVLVAYHVDRMTREGINVAAIILDVVEGKDPETGRVIFAPVRLLDTSGLDSNHGFAFRMQFLMKAEVAREERERIKARMVGRAKRLRLAGRWPGGEIPYGYRTVPKSDGKGKTLEKVHEEAEALRVAASKVLAGDPLARAVRWMNLHAPKPRRAAEWSRTTLKQALTGDHILGRVTIDGIVQREASGRAFAPFPEVLDLATVTELRKALAPTGDPRKAARHPARLASRLIVCSGCGHLLDVARTKTRYRPAANPGEVRVYDLVTYRCQRKSEGKSCDRPVLVSALPFEAYLEEMYLADFGHLPAVERRTVVADDGRLADVEERIALLAAHLVSNATAETFAALQALQRERTLLADAPRIPVTDFVPLGHTVAEEWHRQDIEGKREMLAEAYVELRLHPGRRGGKGYFDPARLQATPAEGVHDPDFD